MASMVTIKPLIKLRPFPIRRQVKWKGWTERIQFADSIFAAPIDERKRRYSVNCHFRGKSYHYDFMLEHDGVCVGWTLMVQKQGSLKEDVVDVEQGKRVLQSLDVKIDLANPSGLLPVDPKEYTEPLSMLDFEGVVPAGNPGATKNNGGVYVNVDRGEVEYLAQKDSLHEYWISGGKMKPGRWVIITYERGNALMYPKEQVPYVIGAGIKKGWVPPKGLSALPEEMRVRVPENLQYWKSEANASGMLSSVREALLTKEK